MHGLSLLRNVILFFTSTSGLLSVLKQPQVSFVPDILFDGYPSYRTSAREAMRVGLLAYPAVIA